MEGNMFVFKFALKNGSWMVVWMDKQLGELESFSKFELIGEVISETLTY